MTIFTTALYDNGGNLLRASQGDPLWDEPTPRQVADMLARAADEGCTYAAGTMLVWADLFEPEEWIEDNPEPDAARAFGPGHPSVPAYRWEHIGDTRARLIPVL